MERLLKTYLYLAIHQGVFFFFGGAAFCSYISGSGPFEKALQNRYVSLAKAALSYHLSPVVAAKNGA